ncbi:MAG TPA: DUF2924 domain-containing protein [Caulobacteraceae bacterium]|nr:DUF2924 domain-containing protein [Caulobacteraceae bacterium]
MDAAITEEVQALECLDLEGLRAEWRRRYGVTPALRSHDLLRRNLAWRIQADAYGGLAPAVREALRRKGSCVPALPTGARLAREWRGVRHEVEVLEGGVILYQGSRYDSLSSVARAITGVRWNGPRFFGLRSIGTV